MTTFDSNASRTASRTAIYVRISRDNPKAKEMAAGVQRQRQTCQALADQQGWNVVATYQDNDKSAYSGKRRPGFEDLLAAIKAGEINTVISWHADRMFRSMDDLERFINVVEVAQAKYGSVNSRDLDLSTSSGRMVARILISVARQESEHHAKRRREANDDMATTGRWCGTGNRTFGYQTAGTNHNKVGVVVEEEAALLRDAADRVLAKETLRSIADEWNAAGQRHRRRPRPGRGLFCVGGELRCGVVRAA